MRKLYFLMLFALLAIGGLKAETKTITISDYGEDAVSGITAENISITFDKASGSSAPKYKSSAVYAYINNTMTISFEGAGVITDIDFDLNFDRTTNTISPNIGSFDKSQKKWSGNAQSITFTTTDEAGKLGGRAEYKAMTITIGEATQVATPEFSLSSGTYFKTQTLKLSCSTDGATIMYTIDNGEEKTYTDAGIGLDAEGTHTIQAWGKKSGLDDSEKVSATYTIDLTEGERVADAQISQVASENDWVTDQVYTSFVQSGVRFEATDGSNPTKYFYNKNKDKHDWRIYEGGTLTVSVPGARLSKIKFEGSGCGNIKEPTTGKMGSDNVWQKTDTDVDAVTFTLSGKAEITGMTVTFVVGDVPEEKCQTPLFSLENGSVFYEPQQLTFDCGTEGATIKYTINEGDEQEYVPGTSEPIELNEYKTYSISAYATKADLANSETITVKYEIKQAVEASSIAEFMEKGASGDMMKFSCPLTVTFVTLDKETTFVKDAEGTEIQIYGKTGQNYTAGDVIPVGAMGKYELYLENTPEVKDILAESFKAAETSEEVVPTALKANALTAADVNRLVSFENVTIADSGNNNYTLTDETGEVKAYHNDKYLAKDVTIPTDSKKYDVTGIVTIFKGNVQVYPTSVVEHTSSGVENAAAGATAIRTTAEGVVVEAATACEVSVFNAAGQSVASVAATEGLNVIDVPAGFYIVKAGDTVAKVVVK